MAVYYFDTSALGKRYISEQGSKWVKSILKPAIGHTIVCSELVRIEICATLARRQRENTLTLREFRRARNTFFLHLRQQYTALAIGSEVVVLAGRLTLKHPLRSLDAIHLASAIVVTRELRTKPIFVSADTRLLTIAQAEGFPTDDPNLHP